MTLFTTAFGFGFAFCMSPGPVLAESLRRGLAGGFRPALLVQLGSLVGDVGWALAAFAGLGLLFTIPGLRVPLEIAGALFLLWLALNSFKDARLRAAPLGNGISAKGPDPFSSGVLMSLTNPNTMLFWLAIGATLGGLGVPSPTSAEAAVFLAGFVAS